jgi:Cu/Ag efflux protein CusF
MYLKIVAAGAALALAACGQQKTPQTETNAPANEAAQTFSGTGKVEAVTADHVTIAHGPISGIGWPAMTMTFTAPDGLTKGVKAGDNVAFSFREESGSHVLASLQKR